MHGIFLAGVMVELESELIGVLNISVNLRCFGSATTTTFFFPVCICFGFPAFFFSILSILATGGAVSAIFCFLLLREVWSCGLDGIDWVIL